MRYFPIFLWGTFIFQLVEYTHQIIKKPHGKSFFIKGRWLDKISYKLIGELEALIFFR